MAAQTRDVHIEQYGMPGDATQLIPQPLGGSVTVYRGTIALTDTAGNIKNASSVASTDKCWGLIKEPSPGCGVPDTGPGITNPSTVAGGVLVNIQPGKFFLASAGGADQLSQSTIGKVVYVVDEITVGLTSNSNARPVAGIHIAVDTTRTPPYVIELGSGLTGPIGV